MEFLLTDQQKMIRAAARDFAENEIAPRAALMDKKETFDMDLFDLAGKLGYLGMSVEAEYGGTFSDYVTSSIINMEFGRACAATATTFGASSGLFGGNLASNGTHEQKEKYLPGIISGKKVGCMGLTEPGAGSDAFSIRTQAIKKGDRYILNGAKTFISNAPIADFALIYATLDHRKGTQGVCTFIVEKDFPGYSAGKKFEKMGLRGSPTGEIILQDCEVPEENLVGMKEGQGLRQMINGLNMERIGWASIAVGLAKAAFSAAFNYSQEREQFGMKIAFFQMIQDKLATMSTLVALGEQNCIFTSMLADSGANFALEAAQCKLFCTDMVMKVTTEAVQIFGGYGFMREFPVECYMRDAKVFAIGAGTNEVQKLLIMQQLLKRGIQ